MLTCFITVPYFWYAPFVEPESKSAKPVAREEQHKAAEWKKKEDTEEEESSDVSVTEESSEEEEEKVWPYLRSS